MSCEAVRAPSTFESVLLAEFNLGLPPLTFYKLSYESSDWSFVLKLHAIIECALGRLLQKRLSEDEYDEGATVFGKVQQAFESGALVDDKHYRSFLLSLNYLRNRFAHQANYIVADIKTVISEMPEHSVVIERRQKIESQRSDEGFFEDW